MEVVIRAGDAWSRRGRPPEPIPQPVMDALLATYRTGEIGVVTIRSQEDRMEAMEFIRYMRKAASRMPGRRLQIQPAMPLIRESFKFRLVDWEPR